MDELQRNKKIKLESRYPTVHTICTLIDNSKGGIITTDGNYVRTILSEEGNNIKAIDFDGGPMVSVGGFIGTKKVKSIKSCYYVELE